MMQVDARMTLNNGIYKTVRIFEYKYVREIEKFLLISNSDSLNL